MIALFYATAKENECNIAVFSVIFYSSGLEKYKATE